MWINGSPIYYFKAAGNVEQWYPSPTILGFEYDTATTLKVFFRGAHDVDAVDVVNITMVAGTSHKAAAENLLTSYLYIGNNPVGGMHPPTDVIKDIVVTGGNGIFPEFVSCTITYGDCCSSGGGSGTMSNWILSDGVTTQQIDNAETVTFAAGTFVKAAVTATNTVTPDLTATGTAGATTFLRGDNTWAIPAGAYTLPLATTTVRGGVELGSDTDLTQTYETGVTGTASRTYPVQLNSADQMGVSVPWTDTGGCADVYKTITGTTGSTVASGCSDTLTIQSPNSSITADAATADTLKLSSRRFESFVITMTDEVRPITTGIKYTFRIPYNFTIAWYGGVVDDSDHCKSPVKIHVNVPPSGGEGIGLTVNVETSTNNGVSWGTLFAVKPTIDNTEYSSVTSSARVQLVADTWGTSITCDTLLRFTVDTVSGSPVGLKCIIMGYQSLIV